MGKASLPKTSINDTLDANKERKKQFGRERAAFTNISGVAATAGSGVNATTNNVVQVTTLPTGGGTMMGPIAFYPKLQFLNTGSTTLDISKATDTSYSSRVIVSGQSNAATISTISGAAHAGQILFLQAASAQTITINETGNISIPGSTTSYVMTANEIILLQYDSTTTKWITITLGGGAGSDANTTLSNLTSPTAINQDLNMQGNSLALDADKDTYIESSTDDTLIMQVGGSSAITINNTNILTAKPISVLIGSVNMNTNPINFQNTGQSISSTSGGIIHSAPTSDTHGFAVNGDLKLSISGSATTLTDNLVMSTNDITSIQNLEFSNNLSTPATNGTIYAQDVSGVRRVFVRTGGATKDLTDIGTGSGGASLSGNNTWTGTNSFNGSYVTVAGTFSATGAAFTIGNASSDQLYINSTMQSDLDMGDNDLTDVQSVRFGAVSLSPLNGTLWYDGSNLKGKSSSGGTFTIDGSGGGSGPTLTSTNTWTGVNTFTSTTSFSVTSPNIYIGDQATDDIDITGEVSIQGGDLTVHNNLQVYNNVVINDALTVHDNVTLGSSSSDTVEVNGDINLNSDVNFTNNTGTVSYNFYSLYSQGYITIKINGSNKRLYYFAG
jgi:hypothetical protein